MRSVHDLKASVLWCEFPNPQLYPRCQIEGGYVSCALWVLVLFSAFCSSFNPSLATGIGSALSLDGDSDEVHVEHAPSLVMTDALTIEAWIIPFGPGSKGAMIVSKEGEYQLARFGDGSIWFAVANESPGWKWIDSGYIVPEGTWAHLALTYSANAQIFQLFVNGVQVFSRTGTGEIGDHQETYNYFKIGAHEADNRHFDGLIDEVRLWNIARTGTEIRSTMNTPLRGNEPGLAGYWNFDDGIANDLSGHENHGTLRENAAIVTSKAAKLFFSTIAPVNIGTTFALDLTVEDVANLAGWQLDVAFNPAVLSAVSIEEGDFLRKNGGNTFFQKSNIDNTAGKITSISGAFIGNGGVSGTGTLLAINFEAKGAGEESLRLLNVTLGSANRRRIPYTIVINRVIVEIYDANGDGTVNVLDLTLIAQHFGQVNPQADVNDNGTVDIFDLIAVAQHLGESTVPLAPSDPEWYPSTPHAATIQNWIDMAHAADDGSPIFQRGIANLYRLLSDVENADLRSLPTETALLGNYPNPFNPETWIPYHLANDVAVTLTIYDIQGVLVRQLDLGHQQAEYYTNRTRAAYWDGRNNLGEAVGSGVYFYHLRAGDYSATRKMVILK